MLDRITTETPTGKHYLQYSKSLYADLKYSYRSLIKVISVLGMCGSSCYVSCFVVYVARTIPCFRRERKNIYNTQVLFVCSIFLW